MSTITRSETSRRRPIRPADLQTAERLCRDVLRIDPRQGDALHVLGMVTHSQGRIREGIETIRQALATDRAASETPDRPPSPTLQRAVRQFRQSWQQYPAGARVYVELGREQIEAGELPAAIGSLKFALAIDAASTPAREALGEAYFLLEDYSQTIEILEPLVAGGVTLDRGSRILAEAYLKSGDINRAVERLESSLDADTSDADLHYKLGRMHLLQRRPQLADRCFLSALQIDPNHEAAWHDRGAALLNQGKTAEARRHFTETLARNPRHVDALCNLGLIHLLSNELDEAEEYCRRALEVEPQHATTRNILGNVLRGKGRLAEAVAEFQQALHINAAFTEAHNNLALSYQTQGKMESAVAHYRRALEVRSNCTATHSNLLLSLHYLPDNDPDVHYREHLNWAAAHGQFPRPERYSNTADPQRRLRIGYVSADFRAHPVGLFIEPILGRRDADLFEVTCYSNATAPDDVTARIEAGVDRWRVTNWRSDDDLAATIAEDGIDILIDLAGHTAGNRLTLFARKPAPVQMTYLGYGSTTGLETIDYRLTDAVADPAGEPQRHSEELIRLQRGLLCYAPPPEAGEVAPAPLVENGYVTFGSFNNPAKINAAVVELWAQVLSALPSARMVLKYPSLQDAGAGERCLELFGQHGIDPRRIDVRGGKRPLAEHFAAYADIDIMLDTFPYTGSTTTCESLWMGVPVITLRGDTFVGRISSSILTQLNMPELITDSAAEYVARAIRLAEAGDELAETRDQIRDEMRDSPLCDAEGYTRELEAAYRNAWQRWCRENS